MIPLSISKLREMIDEAARLGQEDILTVLNPTDQEILNAVSELCSYPREIPEDSIAGHVILTAYFEAWKQHSYEIGVESALTSQWYRGFTNGR